MSWYKDTVEGMEAWFNSHPLVGTVTFGDIGEVDVSSITDFPLVHIVPVQVTPFLGYSYFSFDIYTLNIKEETEEPLEVLDEMADVTIAFTSYYEALLDKKPSAVTVYDQFGNRLYGFKMEAVSFKVLTPEKGC